MPSQALDIVKRLSTDMRLQCLQMIFQTVIDEVHLLHEKEEWKQEITDKHGAITQLPSMFANIVSESVQLIKEALMASDNGREEDLLTFKNAHSDLESLIQNVLSSFAFSLENAALEEYHSETSYIPPETTRLVSCVPTMCLIDASSRVATHHHDDFDLFTFLFSIRMLLDK